MAIELVRPAPAAPFGPGFQIQGQSSFIGPLPQGSYWSVVLEAKPPGEEIQEAWQYVAVDGSLNQVAGLINEQVELGMRKSELVHGQTVQLSVILVQAPSTIIDSKVQDITYDGTSGYPYLSQFQAAGTVTGGYTETDRSRDTKTSAAVLSGFPLTTGLGELAEIGLDAQFGCPPGPLLVPALHGLLSGGGTLTRPSGTTGVYAYGFTFRFEVVPPGLSVIDGRSLTFPERMAQFLVIKVDAAGNEYVSDRYDFHNDQERVCWGIPFPKRLEYSILPGVSLRFSWLVFPVGQ